MIKHIKHMLWYGLLLWVIPFVMSLVIYPIKKAGESMNQSGLINAAQMWHSLFESIMAVTVTAAVVVLAIMYLRKLDTRYYIEAIIIGLVWTAMSVVIDLFLFVWGPFEMTVAEYVCDIGLTYLIYPIVTIGCGVLLEIKR